MSSEISIPEARPETGSTHKVNLDVVMIDAAGILVVGLNGIRQQAREVRVAVSNPLTVLQA